MGLLLKCTIGKRGKVSYAFYGQYQKDGKRVSVAPRLLVPVKGRPPESGKLTDRGDEIFEESRRAAEEKLDRIIHDAYQGTSEEDLARKIFNAATRKRWKNQTIDCLVTAYKSRDYDGERPTEDYIKHNIAVIESFVEWVKVTYPKVIRIADITVEIAKAYRDHLRNEVVNGRKRTTRSLRSMRGALSLAFTSPGVLPNNALNPFGKGALEIRSREGDEVIHREPILNEKMEALVAACKRAADCEMADMMIMGAVTGLRRGDIARLKWSNINLEESLPGVDWSGAMHVRTSKTGAPVDLPIVPSLKEILLRRKVECGESVYVFPEAELQLSGPNHDGESNAQWRLTDRCKAIFVDAFAQKDVERLTEAEEEKRLSLTHLDDEVLADVRTAASRAGWTRNRLELTMEFLRLYAEGKGVKLIRRATGKSTGLISLYLHAAEKVAGIRFMRAGSKKTDVPGFQEVVAATTRTKREGRRAVSIYDFHALRTSFVTALKLGGMSDEEIVKLTGHQYRRPGEREGSLVLELNYNKIKGTDYAARLATILPPFLTGCRPPEAEAGGVEMKRLTADAILAGLSPEEKKNLCRALLKEMQLV